MKDRSRSSFFKKERKGKPHADKQLPHSPHFSFSFLLVRAQEVFGRVDVIVEALTADRLQINRLVALSCLWRPLETIDDDHALRPTITISFL